MLNISITSQSLIKISILLHSWLGLPVKRGMRFQIVCIGEANKKFRPVSFLLPATGKGRGEVRRPRPSSASKLLMIRPSKLHRTMWSSFPTLSLVSIRSSRSSQSSQKMFRRSGRSYGNATQTIANDPDD